MDVIQLANAVTEGLKDVTAPIRVAVMGCIVNGPGEAREADLGVPPATARDRSSFAVRSSRPFPRIRLLRPSFARDALAEELGLEPGSGGVEVAPITAPDVKLPGIDF